MTNTLPPVSEASTILAGVRERFDASEDFTVGIEEEYQLLDPITLALTGRFEDMMAAAEGPFKERLARFVRFYCIKNYEEEIISKK